MKKITKILAIILILAISFTFVACSSYSKIEKAFVKNDYVVVTASDNKEGTDKASKMEQESDIPVKTHLLYYSKNLLKATLVIIFEYNTTKDMKEFYEDSNTMQGLIKDIKADGTAEEFYNALVQEGYANGNCLMIPIGLDVDGAKTIMKNA